MQKLVFINGTGNEINLTSGNFGITNWAGLSNVPLNIQTQQVPFEDGGVYLDALMNQREISVTVAIYDGNNLELRYQKKRELISALNPKLGEGTLIYTNDYLSRQIKAVPQIPLFENKNSNDAGTLKASVSFYCPSPYWEDTEETIIELKDGELKLIENTGDVPCNVKMRLYGESVINPSVINETVNSKIKYDGLFTNGLGIDINTLIGQKEVKIIRNKNNIIFEKNNIVSIASNGNIVVAILIRNILYSNDYGKTWLGVSRNFSRDLNEIVYSKSLNLFVVVGNYGSIYTSPNGITWTPRTSPTNLDLISICYSEYSNRFAVITLGNVLITSTDGITWTQHQNALPIQTNPNRYFRKIRSYTWNIAGSYLIGFIIIGDYGMLACATTTFNWSVKTTGTTVRLMDVNFDDSLASYNRIANKNLVIVGDNGTILLSHDTETWTIENSGVTSLINCICFSPYLKMFFAYSNGFILASKDAKNWKKNTVEFSLNSIINIPDINILMGGGNAGSFYICSDGVSWEMLQGAKNINEIPSLNSLIKINDTTIILGNEGVLFVNQNNGYIFNKLETGYLRSLNDICHHNDLYIIVGNSGLILTSTDGIGWTSRTSGVSTNLKRIIYKKNTYVCVGNSGLILTSTDGIGWTSRTSGVSTNLNDVEYSADLDLFIVIGNTGTLLTSEDLVSWNSVSTGLTLNFNSICYSEERKLFAIACNSGVLLTSTDGISWTSINFNNSGSTNILTIAYSNLIHGFIFALSDNKVYLSSELMDVTSITSYCKNLKRIQIQENEEIYIIGDEIELFKERIDNSIINKLSVDSNMDFKLVKGINELRTNNDGGSIILKLSYRQKYIGV